MGAAKNAKVCEECGGYLTPHAIHEGHDRWCEDCAPFAIEKEYADDEDCAPFAIEKEYADDEDLSNFWEDESE